MLAQPQDAEARTRFKPWWRMIGSAIEHAAGLAGQPIDFRAMFLEQEDDDDDSDALAEAFDIMAKQWQMQFKAKDVAKLINDHESSSSAAALRDLCFPDVPQKHVCSSKSVSKFLTAHVDQPVKIDDRTLILRKWEPTHGGPRATLTFFVHEEHEEAE
jgi:hypothetical protein